MVTLQSRLTDKLVIYDFGMVSYLTDSQRQGLINLVMSIVKDDLNAFICAFEQLGIMAKTSEQSKKELEKAALPFLAFCRGSSITDISLSDLENELDTLLKNHSFKLPANLAYLIRTAVSLEGFVRLLNPDFNFLRAAKPYLKAVNIQL